MATVTARTTGSGRPDTELGWLFVLTYGRSGSTLLQGVLNSVPGYVVRGENGGALLHLYDYHRAAAGFRDGRSPGRRPSSPWYGIGGYTDERAVPAMRRMVLRTLLRPPPGTRVTGFKEIRWGDDLDGYVDFLRALFPGARFVVNTRDHAQVSASEWWQQHPDPRAELAGRETRMLAVADRLGPDAFHVHHDDYVREPERLRGLFDWLGETYDAARLRGVLAVKHGY